MRTTTWRSRQTKFYAQRRGRRGNPAELGGEPQIRPPHRSSPGGGLANHCFRPLSHVSARSFGPKVRLTSNTLRADWLLQTQEVKTIRVGGSCFVSSRSRVPQARGSRKIQTVSGKIDLGSRVPQPSSDLGLTRSPVHECSELDRLSGWY